MKYGNSRLTCWYLSRLYKISNLRSEVLIKNSTKFQDKEVLYSKRFYVHQVENSKFLNETTFKSTLRKLLKTSCLRSGKR